MIAHQYSNFMISFLDAQKVFLHIMPLYNGATTNMFRKIHKTCVGYYIKKIDHIKFINVFTKKW